MAHDAAGLTIFVHLVLLAALLIIDWSPPRGGQGGADCA